MSTPGRGLCLAIPGLSHAIQECVRVPAVLEKILARSNAVPCAADYTEWMFALFGVNNGDAHGSASVAGGTTAWMQEVEQRRERLPRTPGATDLPVAAVTRAADRGIIEPGWWLRADPVYLHTDGDSLLLFDNRSLSVSHEEAAALALELQDLFQEHDAELSAPHPKRWYLHFTHDPGIKTHALDKVLGKHIHACLPNADDAETARRWRRLFNEVQMRLYASPVNQARAGRGALPINSLWFWGGGRLDKQPAARYKKVYADEPLALGLAMLSGAAHVSAPSDAKAWLTAAAEPGEYLAVLEPFMPDHTLAALEDKWFAPLFALLKARELERLELWLGAEKLFEVTPAALGRWWKRSRNLTPHA